MSTNLFPVTLPVLLAGLLLVGCGHTNNLSDFDIAGKSALFRSSTRTLGASSASIDAPTSGNVLVDIAAIVGSGVLSGHAADKLDRAINPDSIAEGVSRGIHYTATTYLALKAVDKLADDPDFIVETELTEFSLSSSTGGLSARVCATSRVVDRRTGKIVWEDSESTSVPLSETHLAGIGPDIVGTGASVYNAVQLLDLKEEEIRRVITHAAEEAGREIGEVLRKDIARMKR